MAAMSPEVFSCLTVAHYQITLKAQAKVSLPAFLGSTLRGAFGHALKEAVCVMPHRQCERCLLAQQCLYPYLFETPVPPNVPQLQGQQQAPHPFVLEPPHTESGVALLTPDARHSFTPETPLRFGLWLVGKAVEALPYVVYAGSLMANGGLGAARAPFTLTQVENLTPDGAARSIYDSTTGMLAPPENAGQGLDEWIQPRLAARTTGDMVSLRFLTPTRIRVAGDLQTALNFALLVRNLLRRISLLAAVHGVAPLALDYPGLIAQAATVATQAAEFSWWDWERLSNRQERKLKLGGFVGTATYHGTALAGFAPLLAAGELLHIGAGTGFGLGRYEID